MTPRRASVVALVLGIALTLTATAGARPQTGADLVERSLGVSPAQLAPGDGLTVADVVTNRGGKKAPASTTRYFLTNGKTRLVAGSRRVPTLKAHRSSRARTQLTIPGDTPVGDYSVLACADATRSVRETNERNNCRTAPSQVALRPKAPPPTAADSDHDGTPDSADCAPHDASIHPGAEDQPDLGFVDSNCDGIDGDAARSIFVSTNGDNANPGTRAHPMRTVAAAVAKAATGRLAVLVAAGTYDEGAGVSPRSNVGIDGGYDPASWARSAANQTLIVGAPQAVLADGATGVTLQLLTLRSNAGLTAGESTYAVRAINRASLTIEHSILQSGDARAGAQGADGARGTNGAAGGAGGPGEDDQPIRGDGGLGGASSIGVAGGKGGIGGGNDNEEHNGAPGGGPFPGAGGSAGASGDPGQDGRPGSPGENGAHLGLPGAGGSNAADLALDRWHGHSGSGGGAGEPGSGGGGGGGGGAQDCFFCTPGGGSGGGGGGAGGGPGSGGGGGGAGGGSFGIYLSNSTVTLSAGTTITAGTGGAGGDGGDGGFGGIAGPGGLGGRGTSEIGAGGAGGRGGFGTRGGSGGGGPGGPSIGLFKQGDCTVVVGPNVTIAFGTAGRGGTGGTPGADGIAAPIFPAQP
jgi:hypothetical protein